MCSFSTIVNKKLMFCMKYTHAKMKDPCFYNIVYESAPTVVLHISGIPCIPEVKFKSCITLFCRVDLKKT